MYIKKTITVPNVLNNMECKPKLLIVEKNKILETINWIDAYVFALLIWFTPCKKDVIIEEYKEIQDNNDNDIQSKKISMSLSFMIKKTIPNKRYTKKSQKDDFMNHRNTIVNIVFIRWSIFTSALIDVFEKIILFDSWETKIDIVFVKPKSTKICRPKKLINK